MSALTFENFTGSPRKNSSRRSYRPVREQHPASGINTSPASLHTVGTGAANKANSGTIALVMAIVIAHIAILYAVNRHGPVASVKPAPLPLTIDIAPPPQVIPPKPLPQSVKPVARPAIPAASVPIVRSDVPVDSAPSADTVQVATAPAPASAPAPAAVVERITEPRGFAGYLNNPAPAYPPAALLKGLQGQVILNVHVLASGRTDSITLFKSSGQRILDDSAIKTVSTWSFDPAKRGDNAIDGWVKVPINFKIS